jgi:Ca2+-binding RTX toxin-like protein
MASFENTPQNDSLTGTPGDDVFDFPVGETGAGSDVFYGGAGNDMMFGGAGPDTFYGGLGDDDMYGGDDSDYFYESSAENDLIYGGDGTFDYLWLQDEVGVTVDITNGSVGNLIFRGIEHVVATAFNDTLIGADSNDSLQGQSGEDLIRGGAGNDFLGLDYIGGTDRDRGIGGAGDDDIYSSGHGDRAFGGAGRDSLHVINDGDQVATLGGGRRVATIEGAGRIIFRGIEDYWSGNGSDILTGSARDNHLYAFGGKDTIFGGGGNDLLVGGDGRDRLDGGRGEDQYNGGEGRDWFVFSDTRDSTEFALDQIADFARGDRIDLRGLTHVGVTGETDINLTWIGSAAFGGTADEVRFADDRLQINVASLPGVTMEIVVYGGDVQERNLLL